MSDKLTEKLESRITAANASPPAFASRIVSESDESTGSSRYRVSISSEAPYQRFWGLETLSHDVDAIDLSRAAADGLPVLIGHDYSGLPIARIRGLYITADRKLEGELIFGDRVEAQEIKKDVDAGIIVETSVSYEILDMELTRKEGDVEEYLVTRWRILEASLCGVPADHTVGVGRSMDNPNTKEIKMSETNTPVDTVDVNAEREDAVKAERYRMNEIRAIGKKLKIEDLAEAACYDGLSVDAFREKLTDHFIDNGRPVDDTKLGMTRAEVDRFSVFKAMKAHAAKDWSNASYERRVSDDAQRLYGRENEKTFTIPDDVLMDPNFIRGAESRDLTSTANGGGNLIGTDYIPGSFIEMLRNRSVTGQTGAYIMDGLVGDVSVSSQTAGGTWYWIDNEGGDTTESNMTIGAVTGTPHTVSGRMDVTRKMLLQSAPAAEGLLRNDMMKGITLAVDSAAINGSGNSGQPEGILAATGIGAVVGGTNGLAPTWAHTVSLETEVAVDNADVGTLAYVTNSKVRGKLKQTTKDGSNAPFIWGESNELNGYRAFVSNQVPSNLDKGTSTGVCSGILFGNWADLILFFWGGIDIKSDEATLGDRGGLVLRVFKDMDVGLRHVQSFAAMQDALTT